MMISRASSSVLPWMSENVAPVRMCPLAMDSSGSTANSASRRPLLLAVLAESGTAWFSACKSTANAMRVKRKALISSNIKIVARYYYICCRNFLCPEKLLPLPDWVMQGENPVKAGSGRAAVREDETGINQCVETEREYMCEGAGSRLIPEPEELWEMSC